MIEASKLADYNSQKDCNAGSDPSQRNGQSPIKADGAVCTNDRDAHRAQMTAAVHHDEQPAAILH